LQHAAHIFVFSADTWRLNEQALRGNISERLGSY